MFDYTDFSEDFNKNYNHKKDSAKLFSNKLLDK